MIYFKTINFNRFFSYKKGLFQNKKGFYNNKNGFCKDNNGFYNNKKGFYNDNKGFFSLLDGILAISILFTGLIIFSSVLNFYNPSISEQSFDSKIANDAIELMTLKFDEKNYSIFENVIFLIETSNNGYNDFETKEKVSAISEGFLNTVIPNSNYLLVENNVLNGAAIASKGNIDEAYSVSSATRNIGNYSFTLFIF